MYIKLVNLGFGFGSARTAGKSRLWSSKSCLFSSSSAQSQQSLSPLGMWLPLLTTRENVGGRGEERGDTLCYSTVLRRPLWRWRRGGVNRGSIHCGALGGKGGDKKEGLLAFHIKDHTLHTHILYLKCNPWVLIQGGNKGGKGGKGQSSNQRRICDQNIW